MLPILAIAFATLGIVLGGPALAAPLAAPALAVGENIRRETGEITVNAVATTVVRYTWRDSAGDPRSVSLVPASGSTMGYAVQMTHTVVDGAKRTAYLEAMPDGDGGFGYFVSHELFRDFGVAVDPCEQMTTIACLHGEDDSPLGRYLPSTGSANSTGNAQATQEFRLNYPRWGTVAAIPQPDGVVVSTNLADHQKFQLPVVVRWHFVAGQDYPLWSVQYDLSAAGDRIATDLRGPYGAMRFNEGVGPDVTALRWGDKYKFAADAGAGDFGAAALAAGGLSWTWNTANAGRRYNVLGSGSYELGLVDVIPFSASRLGDGYASARGKTKAQAGGCAYSLQSMPCDYEWAYQSFQYDYGPPARPKLAWGTSPFLGSSTTTVFINDTETETIVPQGLKRLGVHIVYGRSGTGTPRTLARATAPLEATPALTTAASPANDGSVAYTVHGDAGGPYGVGTRNLAPWDSVSLVATPAAGFTFTGWSGPCAGVTGPTCLIAMGQSYTVTASFTGGAPPPNPARLANISTRMQVLTGNDVLIGGFIISGAAPKTVVVRARGPSLTAAGVPGAISDPVLDLYSGQTIIARNDDWQMAGNAAQVQASGFAPSIAQESAILATLNPGPYTAIVTGYQGVTGVGIVEVFEVDRPDVPLINISTRGQVLTGNDVMIGGFIIQGDSPQTVVVRARGPSLAAAGITNFLANPVLQLFSGATQIAANDNWQTDPNAAALSASGFAPSNPFEAAILITLNPGAYTAIVTGAGGTTGVGIIEVFAQ